MGLGSNSVRDRTCNRRIDISHRGRPAIAAPSACQSEKCALVAADVRAQLRALHFSLVADVLATCLETDWRQGQERLGSHPLDIRLVLLASAALLLVAHGAFNDWGIRTTLPLWPALAIAIAQVLWIGLKWAYLTVFLVVVVLSSAASLAEVAISAVVPSYCAPYGVFSLEDMGPLAFQYEGRRKSMLYRYFARSR